MSYKVRHLILEQHTYSVQDTKSGKKRRIGTHDFFVLFELCKNAGNIVTKEQLLEKAWPGKVVADSSLTQAISNVRSIIGDNGKEQLWLKTISKVGYSLDLEIVQQYPNIPHSDTEIIDNSRDVLGFTPEKTIKKVGITQHMESSTFLSQSTYNRNHILKIIFLCFSVFSMVILASILSLRIYTSQQIKHHSDVPPRVYTGNKIEIYSDTPQIINQSQFDALVEIYNIQFLSVMISGSNISLSVIKTNGDIINRLSILENGNSSLDILSHITRELSNDVN